MSVNLKNIIIQRNIDKKFNNKVIYMKTGLLLEGGGMRGLYTAGVLDVLMENSIKIDTIIGVSAGALFGMNYKSKQKGRVLRYNKKFVETINNRYIRYNEQLNKILDLEKNKKIFVIRPSKLIKIGRVENLK